MKKMIFALFLLGLASTYAQTTTEKETPYIEVVGSAEKEVIPDEFYISISLRERYNGKDKITIEKLESDLKTALRNISINIEKNLSLAETYAHYEELKKNKGEEFMAGKQFLLKVGDATAIKNVYQQFNTITIEDARISNVVYLKTDSLEKALRIEAIKNAKDKATYTLSAIGEQVGKVLAVTTDLLNPERMSTRYTSDLKFEEVEYEKIKVTAFVTARFAIK